MEEINDYLSCDDFRRAMMNHEEPICPNCKKGKIVCPEGKVEKPHFFECTNQCGWYANIDYNDILIE